MSNFIDNLSPKDAVSPVLIDNMSIETIDEMMSNMGENTLKMFNLLERQPYSLITRRRDKFSINKKIAMNNGCTFDPDYEHTKYELKRFEHDVKLCCDTNVDLDYAHFKTDLFWNSEPILDFTVCGNRIVNKKGVSLIYSSISNNYATEPYGGKVGLYLRNKYEYLQHKEKMQTNWAFDWFRQTYPKLSEIILKDNTSSSSPYKYQLGEQHQTKYLINYSPECINHLSKWYNSIQSSGLNSKPHYADYLYYISDTENEGKLLPCILRMTLCNNNGSTYDWKEEHFILVKDSDEESSL